jgi:hypothetical protein
MSKKKIDLIKEELNLYLANPSLVMKQKGWTQDQFDSYITDLTKKIEQSKRGKASKRKGASYERVIAKLIRDTLKIILKRTPMSGGFAKKEKGLTEFKGDINSAMKEMDFKLHLELKDHATWSLPEWLRQAESDCPKGKIPVVVFHRRQKNLDGKRVQEAGDYVTLKLTDFLAIIDRDKIVEQRAPIKIVKKVRSK